MEKNLFGNNMKRKRVSGGGLAVKGTRTDCGWDLKSLFEKSFRKRSHYMNGVIMKLTNHFLAFLLHQFGIKDRY